MFRCGSAAPALPLHPPDELYRAFLLNLGLPLSWLLIALNICIFTALLLRVRLQGKSPLQQPQAARPLPVSQIPRWASTLASAAGPAPWPAGVEAVSAALCWRSSQWPLAWLPGLRGWRVVGQEEAFGGAAPHGAVGVEKQPREALGEVLHEAVGDLAQRSLRLHRQLPVVVLLSGWGEQGSWFCWRAFQDPGLTQTQNTPCSSWPGAGLAPMSPYMTGTFSDLRAEKWALELPPTSSPWPPWPAPGVRFTCLQRQGNVLVPVMPDHLVAACLQRSHQGPLLRLLLQPVTNILGPTELLSLGTGLVAPRPRVSCGRSVERTASWFRTIRTIVSWGDRKSVV